MKQARDQESGRQATKTKIIRIESPQAPRLPGHRLSLTTLQSQIGNAAVQRILTGRISDTIQQQVDKKKPSAVGYVGLNPRARKEARALRRNAHERVVVSLNDAKAQAALQTWQGKVDFVFYHLGIDWSFDFMNFLHALKCLQECDPAFCDQMADMMRMFKAAENGNYQLERLVLSGHHIGGKMWGDNAEKHEPGAILLNRDLPNLAKTFRDAAAQVEDIMFSACNTKEQVLLCVKIFPNLKTVWVYDGYSPSIEQGSARHITQWERQTRGERQPRSRDRSGNVAIWTSENGFLVDPGTSHRN